jgi:two-component system OmpR family sensor kinase
MLATAFSPASRNRLVVGWAVFVLINIGAMYAIPGKETIPFHFVWISYTLMYGLVPWRPVYLWVTFAGVTLATGWILVHHAQAGYVGFEETAEIPLMAGIFLVMVWHVNRRQAALRQVSALAALERRRAEAQQLFIRLGSHELRTPITVARGYTELIRAAHPDPETDEDTAIVLDELAKLERITARLLTLMQAETPSVVARVDLDILLERVVRRWSPTATRDWRVDTRAGLGLVDVERLETALDCLLENAVKFTDPGDLIALHAWRQAGDIIVEVTDSGSGIAPEDLPLIFDNFTTGGDIGDLAGTGLGLPIVRAFVQARGGTVGVRSTPGAGATFVIKIPEQMPPIVVPAEPDAVAGLARAAGNG